MTLSCLLFSTGIFLHFICSSFCEDSSNIPTEISIYAGKYNTTSSEGSGTENSTEATVKVHDSYTKVSGEFSKKINDGVIDGYDGPRECDYRLGC